VLALPRLSPRRQLKLVESEASTTDQPTSKGSDELPTALAAATSASRERHRAPIPWQAFFTDRQFWAFYLNFFASGFGTFVLLAWMPTYFSDQFGVKLADIGFFTAAPYIFQAVCTVIAGTLSQRLIASKTLSPMATCTLMQMIGARNEMHTKASILSIFFLPVF
jgi:nitrate/nitrite transporter NarK